MTDAETDADADQGDLAECKECGRETPSVREWPDPDIEGKYCIVCVSKLEEER